ncbi:MAG: SRPBCC family protein [Acidobacteriia bacterium]|nr:SRPBCC family protein [Terriglobia bacterium]
MSKLYRLEREQAIPCPIEKVFAFFADVRNLEAITPPWLNFRVLTPAPIRMEPGAEMEYQLAWRRFRLRWKTQITEWKPPQFFVDVQARGPYRLWEHTHSFRSEDSGTRMFDSVRYQMPFGIVGQAVHGIRVRRDLDRIFDYRAAAIGRLFREHTGATGTPR